MLDSSLNPSISSTSVWRHLVTATLTLLPMAASAVALPTGIAEAVASGTVQEIIVEYESQAVEREVQDLRGSLRLRHDNSAVLALRETRYRQVKARTASFLPTGEFDTVADFKHLPMSLLRIRSSRALTALANHSDVVGIYRNQLKYPVPDLTPQLDSTSQSFVGQPAAAAAGLTGSGTTVLVIDTGANYTVSDLGSCTTPATPTSCRISHALYVNAANAIVSDPTAVTSTSNNHGTNVASIVAGVATATRIAVVNVFGTNSSTSDAKILAAINWGIANQSTYNIRAMNLSLGDSTSNASYCTSGNPYVSAFANARAAGIVPVAASGNNGFLDGIASPACTPGAVSVGAVYAANYGTVGWSSCTDSTTAADKVVCFSNSASFLGMLAPGAIITAGGLTMGGTSQASPFVAASMGLLYAAYPSSSIDEQVDRLKNAGVGITDPRNGLVTKRLDLNPIATAVTAAAANPGDVPTLPEWAALLLGAFLLTCSVRTTTKRSPQ